jgi:hypothetical protein
MTRLEHALALARQGLLILPIQPGKKTPFGNESWTALMTTDEATIRGWFESRPDMNYAVCPGKGAVILDPDMDASKGKNGLAALADIETENFEDPISEQTLTVRSPRGGQHIYLRTPYSVSNSKSRFADAIDVRGFGGYVVGPGSHTVASPEDNTAEGTYEVICDKPLMDAPQWVLDRLAAAAEKGENNDQPPPQGWDTDYAIEAARQIIRAQTSWPTQGQNGDDATYKFIVNLRDYGISKERMLELLHEPLYEDGSTWDENCDPPWGSELELKIENVYKYGAFQPGLKGGVIDMAENYGVEEAAQAEAVVRAERKGVFDKVLFNIGDFFKRNVTQEFVIREWLLAHGMTALLAKRGTGKTVAMADMAFRIASDMDWHGVPVKKGYAVVYLCGEDDIGFQQHLKAWCKTHPLPPSDRMFVATMTPSLMSGDEVKAWATEILERMPGRKIVTFVDTWQRATSSASQNDDKEMQNAAANAEALAKALNGPVVISFHPPKNNPDTLMGSSIIENMTVGIWTMKMDGDNFHRLLTVARLKGKGERNSMKFEYKEVGIGEIDEFGKEKTGLIALKQGGTSDADVKYAESIAGEARFWYASIIGRLLAEYKSEGGAGSKAGDFSLVDTARRLKEFLNGNDSDAKRYRMELANAKDNGYLGEADSFKRHLGALFISRSDPQVTDAGIFISVDVENRTRKKFRIDDAALEKAEKMKKLAAKAPSDDDEDF